jgi:hypothetical protein
MERGVIFPSRCDDSVRGDVRFAPAVFLHTRLQPLDRRCHLRARQVAPGGSAHRSIVRVADEGEAEGEAVAAGLTLPGRHPGMPRAVLIGNDLRSGTISVN